MSAPTPGQALSPDPADFAYHVRATAFNVLTGMAGGEWHVPRSERDAIARAVVDAIEPLIRADERAAAAQEPHAAPELQTGPCPFEGHDGEHLRLNTHDHWLCAIQLTNMLVAADVIADPAPDVAKVRAELSELTGNHARLLGEILKNADQDISDADEAAECVAEEYVRWLETERRRLLRERTEREPLTVKPADDVKPAPELAAAMREVRAADALRRQLADLTAAMHAEAQTIAPASSEPDGMPDIADQVRAQVLHEYAARIRQLLEA